MDDGKMIVIHAGGRGSLGITTHLYSLGKLLSVYVIEAAMEEAGRWGRFERLMFDAARDHGSSATLVKGCISDDERDIEFNVMHDVRASSVYKIHPDAVGYCCWGSARIRTLFPWIDACRVTAQIPMRTTTLDLLCREQLPMPNVLSMDIQGSDYAALVGAKTLLESDDLLCINAEAPLRPIYDGQGTFSDIDILLRQHGFQFVEFTHVQEWWDDLIVGKGFLAVTEALFFRNFHHVRKVENLVRLAVLAHLFGHSWYGNKVTAYLYKEFSKEISLLEKASFSLWHLLLKQQRPMKQAMIAFRARAKAASDEQKRSRN